MFSNTFVRIAPTAADVYKVEVSEVEQYVTQAGNARYRIRLRVIEGVETKLEQADCTISDGLNLVEDKERKKKAEKSGEKVEYTPQEQMLLRLWMTLYGALGVPQQEMREYDASMGWDFDNVSVEGTFEYLPGRQGWVRYLPADADEGRQWSKTVWLTGPQATEYAKAQKAVKEAKSSDDDSDPLGALLG